MKLRRQLLPLSLWLTAWRLVWASSEWQVPYPQPPFYSSPPCAYENPHSYRDSTEAVDASVPFEMPDLHLNHVSLSLRLTCEMNRQLLQGIRESLGEEPGPLHEGTNYPNHQRSNGPVHNPLLQRGGDDNAMYHHPVNVHPSQSWQPPIKEASSESNENLALTLFHAKSPRVSSKRRTGIARWGPELLSYLEYLVKDVLELPEEQWSLILALTVVYLDRACSVETSRGMHAACPFLEPRTVHRLTLISMVTAAQAVLADQVDASRIQELLKIPPSQFQQMEDTFQKALGDFGLYVDPFELQQFMVKWQSRFQKRKVSS